MVQAILVWGAAWAAAGLYAATVMWRAIAPQSQRWPRWLWTAGWILLIAHIVGAFAYVYHWNHDAAIQATRRQTLETMGIAAGWGVYVNYVFAIIWAMDVVGWWRHPAWPSTRWWPIFLHGFAAIMIYSATILFVPDSRKGMGIVLAVVMLVAGVLRHQRHVRLSRQSPQYLG